MGSIITLGIKKFEIDWGKNFSFNNHSKLYTKKDFESKAKYYYVSDEDKLIVEEKEVNDELSKEVYEFDIINPIKSLEPYNVSYNLIINGIKDEKKVKELDDKVLNIKYMVLNQIPFFKETKKEMSKEEYNELESLAEYANYSIDFIKFLFLLYDSYKRNKIIQGLLYLNGIKYDPEYNNKRTKAYYDMLLDLAEKYKGELISYYKLNKYYTIDRYPWESYFYQLLFDINYCYKFKEKDSDSHIRYDLLDNSYKYFKDNYNCFDLIKLLKYNNFKINFIKKYERIVRRKNNNYIEPDEVMEYEKFMKHYDAIYKYNKSIISERSK